MDVAVVVRGVRGVTLRYLLAHCVRLLLHRVVGGNGLSTTVYYRGAVYRVEWGADRAIFLLYRVFVHWARGF